MLILDEATSSVDALTEVRVARALERLAASRTTIAIAHRLSTAARADRVLVLEHGRLVEDGHHDDLIASDGPVPPSVRRLGVVDLRLIERSIEPVSLDVEAERQRAGDIGDDAGDVLEIDPAGEFELDGVARSDVVDERPGGAMRVVGARAV